MSKVLKRLVEQPDTVGAVDTTSVRSLPATAARDTSTTVDTTQTAVAALAQQQMNGFSPA